MTCSPVRVNGMAAIICHRGPRIQQCAVKDCEEIAGYACDWKVGAGTCDAPMCNKHRHNVGRGKDLCFAHANAWRNHPANPNRELDL